MALCKAEETLSEALTGFDFGGQIVGAVRYGKGHINDTFCDTPRTRRATACALFCSASTPTPSPIRTA